MIEKAKTPAGTGVLKVDATGATRSGVNGTAAVAVIEQISPYERLTAALEVHGCDYREESREWECPVHGGHALKVDDRDGDALVYCHFGCGTSEVVKAVGLNLADLSGPRDQDGNRPGPVPSWATRPYVVDGKREYSYVNESGDLLYVVTRKELPGGEKRFSQCAADGTPSVKGVRPVLYRLPAVLKAIEAGRTIHLSEGEKAADALHASGEVSTCNSGGSGQWRDELADSLKGAVEVIVWQDRDDAGAKWAAAVAGSLEARDIKHRAVQSRTEGPTDDAWDHLAAGWSIDQAVPVGPAVESVATHLPEGFWSSRKVLAHIRTAAHARAIPADAVLYGVFTRVASLLPGDLRVDTNMLRPASLNLFTALVAGSGVGKSSSQGLAADLVPVPSSLEEADYQDSVPIGSGEGLAEGFMGKAQEAVGTNRDGSEKTQLVRKQVRHNALYYVDEGKTLTTLMTKREGSTLGQAIRTAWMGAVLGQMNGTEERTRVVRDYAMGMVVGFQPSTALPLLDGVEEGTPQRFIYATADDPTIPDEGPDDPGPLWGPDWLDKLFAKDGSRDPFDTQKAPNLLGGGAHKAVTLVVPIRKRLRAEHLERQRGKVETDPYDSHRPLMLIKLSALLALLDGRTDVTEEDWSLATVMWGTSSAIRRRLLRAAERNRERVRTERRQERVEDAVAVHKAKAGAEDTAERIARRLHRIINTKGSMPRSALRRDLGRDKPHFGTAMDRATARGWLAEEESARGVHVVLGEAPPTP